MTPLERRVTMVMTGGGTRQVILGFILGGA
jgi:hypothetical protein